jgi:hypothetical protein
MPNAGRPLKGRSFCCMFANHDPRSAMAGNIEGEQLANDGHCRGMRIILIACVLGMVAAA